MARQWELGPTRWHWLEEGLPTLGLCLGTRLLRVEPIFLLDGEENGARGRGMVPILFFGRLLCFLSFREGLEAPFLASKFLQRGGSQYFSPLYICRYMGSPSHMWPSCWWLVVPEGCGRRSGSGWLDGMPGSRGQTGKRGLSSRTCRPVLPGRNWPPRQRPGLACFPRGTQVVLPGRAGGALARGYYTRSRQVAGLTCKTGGMRGEVGPCTHSIGGCEVFNTAAEVALLVVFSFAPSGKKKD